MEGLRAARIRREGEWEAIARQKSRPRPSGEMPVTRIVLPWMWELSVAAISSLVVVWFHDVLDIVVLFEW